MASLKGLSLYFSEGEDKLLKLDRNNELQMGGRADRIFLLRSCHEWLGKAVPVRGFSRGGISVAGFFSFLHLLKSWFSIC